MSANINIESQTAKLVEDYNRKFKPRESDWQFRNNKVEADDYGLSSFMEMDDNKNEFDSNCSAFTVDIELQPEMREHCIKSIGIVIARITGSVFWNNRDANEKYTDGEIVIDTLTTHSDWTIDNELHFEEDGGLFVGSISIDFREKTITVS